MKKKLALNVNLEPWQYDYLHDLSKEEGESIGKLVREAIGLLKDNRLRQKAREKKLEG